MEFIKLKKVPSRETLIEKYPPDKALFILPGKEEDAYQPPHKLPHEGERKTTFGEMMRPKVIKGEGENYEYDLNCIGLNVIENDGVTFNQEKSESSFSQVYYFIGTGLFEKIVAPPVDPTLPLNVRNYINHKYQMIEKFIQDPKPENLMSPRDLKNYQRGLAEKEGMQHG